MLTHTAGILFENQHQQLPEILSLTDPSQWQAHPIAGKWSIHDQIAHLASYQPVFAGRLKQILETENIAFARYHADDDPAFLAAQSETSFRLLQSIDAGRTQLTGVVRNLSAAKLNRRATHPLYGQMTLSSWIDFFLLHEAHHHFAIFRLQALQMTGANG